MSSLSLAGLAVPSRIVTAPLTRSRANVQDFAQAAQNAVEAGFGGVEIHGANGDLHGQFLNPKVNDRSDRYAGSTTAGRLAFTLEVVDAIAARIGAARIGIRVSPYGQLFDMPAHDEVEATCLALASELSAATSPPCTAWTNPASTPAR